MKLSQLRKLKELEVENGRLKKLYAELSLAHHALQDAVYFWNLARPERLEPSTAWFEGFCFPGKFKMGPPAHPRPQRLMRKRPRSTNQ